MSPPNHFALLLARRSERSARTSQVRHETKKYYCIFSSFFPLVSHIRVAAEVTKASVWGWLGCLASLDDDDHCNRSKVTQERRNKWMNEWSVFCRQRRAASRRDKDVKKTRTKYMYKKSWKLCCCRLSASRPIFLTSPGPTTCRRRVASKVGVLTALLSLIEFINLWCNCKHLDLWFEVFLLSQSFLCDFAHSTAAGMIIMKLL